MRFFSLSLNVHFYILLHSLRMEFFNYLICCSAEFMNAYIIKVKRHSAHAYAEKWLFHIIKKNMLQLWTYSIDFNCYVQWLNAYNVVLVLQMWNGVSMSIGLIKTIVIYEVIPRKLRIIKDWWMVCIHNVWIDWFFSLLLWNVHTCMGSLMSFQMRTFCVDFFASQKLAFMNPSPWIWTVVLLSLRMFYRCCRYCKDRKRLRLVMCLTEFWLIFHALVIKSIGMDFEDKG